MQSTHACIFARFTRKMHGNYTGQKSARLGERCGNQNRYGLPACREWMLGILRMLGESFAFAPRNESLAYFGMRHPACKVRMLKTDA